MGVNPPKQTKERVLPLADAPTRVDVASRCLGYRIGYYETKDARKAQLE